MLTESKVRKNLEKVFLNIMGYSMSHFVKTVSYSSSTQSLSKDKLYQLTGMDSLDIVEYIMAIEEEFDILLDDEEFENLTSFDELVNLIKRELKAENRLESESESNLENNTMNTNDVRGITMFENGQAVLLLPSLQNQDKFIVSMGLTREEALDMVNHHAFTTEMTRKIKYYDNDVDVTDHMEFYHMNNKDEIDGDTLALISDLAYSDVPTYRGVRAVFVDLERNVIGIGTTVVYNENWATIGFADKTIYNKLDTIMN